MRNRVDPRSGSHRKPRRPRRRPRLRWLASLVVPLLLAVPAAASADATLGTTTQPANSIADPCFGLAVVGQLVSDPTTPYVVPAGGGEISGWQTNTTNDVPGTPLTLVVLKPLADNTYSVVGADNESIPTPLPANNIASFTLATPITVTGGETLGLYSAAPSEPTCFWSGGSTPAGDGLIALGTGTSPAAGQTLSEIQNGNPTSGPEYTLNLVATLVRRQDAGVTTGTPLANASPGNPALLASTVSNAGPLSVPITFTDDVPAGLQIDSAVAGSGSCATSGQQVTCTISGLAPGQSAPVDIVVTPNAAGGYANSVSVNPATGVSDPNPTNDAASAILTVTAPPAPVAPPTPKCVVPALKGIPAAFARHVLGLLGCTVGRVRNVHSHETKGDVVTASPGAGTYAAGQVVALEVSSGPKHSRKPTRR